MVSSLVEVNGFHSFSFAFQFSSFDCAGSAEDRMSAFGKVEHHVLSSFVPKLHQVCWHQLPHYFFSDPGHRNDQCPRVNLQAYSATLRAFAIQFSVSSFSPFNVIVHWHGDDPFFELLRFTLQFRNQGLLNLVENSQCSESWEICPLEFHLFTVDSIQFLKIRCFQKAFNLTFPCLDWFNTSENTLVFAVANWTALWHSRVVDVHMSCRQSIVVTPVISVWSMISFWITWNNCLIDFFGWLLVDLIFSVQSIPRWTAGWRVTDRNFPIWLRSHRGFSFWSLGLRPYLCLTIEKTLAMCGSQSVDIWKLVWQHFVFAFDFWVSWSDEFPSTYWIFRETQMFLVSYFSSSVATSLLVPTSRNASFCHTWELDAASWLNFLASGFPVFVQAAFVTSTECLNYQCVPNAGTTGRFERRLLTILCINAWNWNFVWLLSCFIASS